MALNILLGFVAFIMIVNFLSLGLGLYSLLKKQFPDADPLVIVNGYLFYWLLGDLVMRFFLQKLPVMTIKPLLTLPIKKNKILHYVLGKSAVSFFNFLPLFTIIPFGVVLLFHGYNGILILTWMILLFIFTLIINFLNFIIESKSADTELSFLPIIILSAGLFGLNYLNIISIGNLLAEAVNAITSNPVLLLIPGAILSLLYYINYSILNKKLYIDGSLKAKTQTATTTDLTWTRRFGDIAPFLQLDLKIIVAK